MRATSTWERAPLDVDAMQRAAQALIGEHDFSAFRTVACQARSPSRNVHEIAIARDGDEVAIEIEANAFLHHMVRNIVGSLLPIGRGEQPRSMARRAARRPRSREGGPDRARCGPDVSRPALSCANGTCRPRSRL